MQQSLHNTDKRSSSNLQKLR